jgi:hypothetical protein
LVTRIFCLQIANFRIFFLDSPSQRVEDAKALRRRVFCSGPGDTLAAAVQTPFHKKNHSEADAEARLARRRFVTIHSRRDRFWLDFPAFCWAGETAARGRLQTMTIRQRKYEGGTIGQDNEQDGSAQSKAARGFVQPGKASKDRHDKAGQGGSSKASKGSFQAGCGRSEKRSRRTDGSQDVETSRIEAGNEVDRQARSNICNSKDGRKGRAGKISRQARCIQATGRQSYGRRAGWQNFREASSGQGSDGQAGRQGEIEARNAEGDIWPACRRRQALA